ncbi:hypothetical protein PWT90_02809 [Aphanocladium album]|nr:hypothetical protein PWT90_02809 [Aphanocladium album]
MAEGGNGPEDVFSNPYLFDPGFANTAWGQEADDSHYGIDALMGFCSANPQVDSSFDFFNPSLSGNEEDHIANSWDSDLWSSATSDLSNGLTGLPPFPEADGSRSQRIQPPPPEFLDPRFAAPITPPKQQPPPQPVFKQEYSPVQHVASYPHSRAAQASVIVPQIQYGPPPVIRTSNLSRVPVPGEAPPSPVSPVQRKRASSSSTRSTPGVAKPKKRMIKQQVKGGGKARMTALQLHLRRLVDAEGTGVFQQHIPSTEAAAANHAELMRLFSKAPSICSGPDTDPTFPISAAEQLVYVRDLFDAIWDWNDYLEMGKTLGSDKMALWREAQQLRDGDPRKAALLRQIPSRAEQQKKVVSRVLSDYVVEEICWRLVCRVAAICESLRGSKQMVKSLFSAGNGWCMRVANNPQGEFMHKRNNMKVNLRKTVRLREVTNSQKEEI